MSFRSPFQRRAASPDVVSQSHVRNIRVSLTPVMEEFSHLRVTSSVKKSRDDFNITPTAHEVLELEIPEWNDKGTS